MAVEIALPVNQNIHALEKDVKQGGVLYFPFTYENKIIGNNQVGNQNIEVGMVIGNINSGSGIFEISISLSDNKDSRAPGNYMGPNPHQAKCLPVMPGIGQQQIKNGVKNNQSQCKIECYPAFPKNPKRKGNNFHLSKLGYFEAGRGLKKGVNLPPMARILTGIQSTNIPHLGNILGAVLPGIQLSRKSGNDSFFFIADLHSLTSIKEGEVIRRNTRAVAATWLAFGFDVSSNCFYRQSRVTEVCELAWFLNCFTPYPMLANAHSFKDKSSRLSDVNAGLFTYPVLMAADILLYDANLVPVGKDQQQHLEMTRDIAGAFNRIYGDTFVLPDPLIDEKVMIVPGIDGQKMSKSYNNFISIFLPEKELLKVVKTIVTDATPLEAPKNPDTCNVFAIYKLLADAGQEADLRKKYLAGGFGYGHAKQALYELILEKYKEERRLYNELVEDETLLETELSKGEEKARKVARSTLSRVKEKTGYY